MQTPRLSIKSPEKGCGKTTLLDTVATLAARPLPSVNVTAAVVFRVVDQFKPTYLIDEADRFLGDNNELIGIINAGYRKGGRVQRLVGDNHDVRNFSAWSPVAIASIGRIPDTIEDRSLRVTLRRATDREQPEVFNSERVGHMKVLARKMARWAKDHAEQFRVADPDMGELRNRVADNWRPFFAMADLMGAAASKRVREVARKANDAQDDQSVNLMLLSDIRDLFKSKDSPEHECEAHYLGRVVPPDKEAAIHKAMEEFRIEPARRFRLIVVPVE
jgi:hypothetical protein